MSKKWIISLVAVGIVVAVVLILFWTLFGLSSVTVDFQSSLKNLDVSAQEIVDAGEFHLGACVLFEGKKKSVQKIYDKASDNPKFAYIRVVNIETIFPNRFVIHVAEREELFAVEKNGQVLICDRDFRVLNFLKTEENDKEENLSGQERAKDAFVSTPTNPIFLSGLEIENEEVQIGDFLEIGQTSMKNFYSTFLQNNRSFSEIVGKFEKAQLSSYVEDVTNEKYDALTLSTFGGQEFVIKNPDFAFANKVALMYAVESTLFSQNVDKNGDILDASGQPIYLVKNARGQYLLANENDDLSENGQTDEQQKPEKFVLNFQLLGNCRIVVDNFTLSQHTDVGETDLYFYLQEKTENLA